MNDTCNRGIELTFAAGVQYIQLYSTLPRGNLHVIDNRIGPRKGRVHEQSQHGGVGNQFMQQLQALSLQRSAELADARSIAAWPVKAGNEAQLDRVDTTGENDWQRRGCCLGRDRRRRGARAITAT